MTKKQVQGLYSKESQNFWLGGFSILHLFGIFTCHLFSLQSKGLCSLKRVCLFLLSKIGGGNETFICTHTHTHTLVCSFDPNPPTWSSFHFQLINLWPSFAWWRVAPFKLNNVLIDWLIFKEKKKANVWFFFSCWLTGKFEFFFLLCSNFNSRGPGVPEKEMKERHKSYIVSLLTWAFFHHKTFKDLLCVCVCLLYKKEDGQAFVKMYTKPSQ